MSILDTIKEKLTGTASEETITGHLTDFVNSPEIGGYQGLMQKFQNHGLGDAAKSWFAGAGQSISSDQLASVLGQDKLNALASKFGVEPEKLSGIIAQYLPTVMTKLKSLTGTAA